MDTRDIRLGARQWVWIASIWGGLGLFDALQTVFVMRSERMHHAWLILFATVTFSWLPWALATPLILRLARKFPPKKPIRIMTWLVHLSACTTMGLVFSAWTSWLDFLFDPYLDPVPSPYMPLWFGKFYNGLLSFVVLYAAILTLNYVLDTKAAGPTADRDRATQRATREGPTPCLAAAD
jgi:two-component system, LytTR family, sensor kinase